MRINSEAIIFRFPLQMCRRRLYWMKCALSLSLSLSLLLFKNIFPIEEEFKLLLVLEEALKEVLLALAENQFLFFFWFENAYNLMNSYP